MALSQDTYTASASQQDFTVTFGYITTAHVKVYVDSVEDTTYTWQNATTVRLTTPCVGGETVLIDRDTPTAARLVDFTDATVLTAATLDRDSNQTFYMAQEAIDAAEAADTGGEDNIASNVGVAGIGLYKQKVGTALQFKNLNVGSSKITLTDDTANDEIDIDVDEAQLTLGNIGGQIATAQIEDDAVGYPQLADGSVTNATLGDMSAYSIKLRNNGLSGDPGDYKVSDLTDEPTPTTGDYLLGETAAGALVKVNVGNLPGSVATGEANTASNVGAGGVSVYKQKASVDLEFNSINAGSSKVTVTLDGTNNEVDVDVAEANLTLGNIGGTITAAKLDTDAVETTRIKDANVTSPKIADANVTTAKLADSNVTNAKLADATAYTLKMRNAGTTGAVSDVKISSLTEEASPEALDWILGELADGTLVKYDVGNLPSGGAAPVVRTPHTWAFSGEIKVASGDTDFIPPMFVSKDTGQTLKLVKARYKINSGTNCNVKLQKNGVDITGFTSMTVTTTATSTTPTAVTLVEDDMIALVVNSVSATPTNLSFTIFLESTI